MGIQARLTADPHFAHVMTLPEHVVNRRYESDSHPNLIDNAIACASLPGANPRRMLFDHITDDATMRTWTEFDMRDQSAATL